MEDCIFCKIIKRELPSKIVYEDNEIIAFEDINKEAPVHILIVPKKHINSNVDLETEDAFVIGKIFLVANKIARDFNIEKSGFRIITNSGEDSGQLVKHIHFHLIGGTKLGAKIN